MKFIALLFFLVVLLLSNCNEISSAVVSSSGDQPQMFPCMYSCLLPGPPSCFINPSGEFVTTSNCSTYSYNCAYPNSPYVFQYNGDCN